MPTLTIGQLGKAAGVKVPTIRFYEQVGLLPEPLRTDSNRRVYEAASVRRLAFIRNARELRFPTEAIRTLLELADHPDRACDGANALAAEQLVSIKEKIAQLTALRAELERMIASGCSGPARECQVIETLAVDASRGEIRRGAVIGFWGVALPPTVLGPGEGWWS